MVVFNGLHVTSVTLCSTIVVFGVLLSCCDLAILAAVATRFASSPTVRRYKGVAIGGGGCGGIAVELSGCNTNIKKNLQIYNCCCKHLPQYYNTYLLHLKTTPLYSSDCSMWHFVDELHAALQQLD